MKHGWTILHLSALKNKEAQVVSRTGMGKNTTTTNVSALFCIQKKKQSARTRYFPRRVTFPKSKALALHSISACKKPIASITSVEQTFPEYKNQFQKAKHPNCIQVLNSIPFNNPLNEPCEHTFPKAKRALHSKGTSGKLPEPPRTAGDPIPEPPRNRSETSVY